MSTQKSLLLTPDEKGIVVFTIWQSLAYNTRLLLSFALILSGLGIQFVLEAFSPGFLLLIAGNVLLFVKGYDNRVDYGKFNPSAQWETVEAGKLKELLQFDRKVRKWDISVLDITNGVGAFVFLIVAACLVLFFFFGGMQMVALDATILLLPHWVTGIRSILVKPKLMVKANVIEDLLKGMHREIQNHNVDVLMLLKGENDTIPDDIKFKVNIQDRRQDFLGLYGQVVINEVQGASYPYFYAVLVAKKGFGLRGAFETYQPSKQIIKEFKDQDEVEVFIIRQKTTKTSGYHTKSTAVRNIFLNALQLAEAAAKTK